MTDREIRRYIDRLNAGKHTESIFTRPISENVDFAKVWDSQPRMDDRIVGNFSSNKFFFIKNEDKKYVGAVQDGGNDLHWYVLPKERKKGFLTKALQEAILPYLFNNGRESQEISIKQGAIGRQNYLNSKKVALNLGFKATNEDETKFCLSTSEFDWKYEGLNERDTKIDHERFEELRKRVFYAYKILYKISDELLMAIGDDDDLEFTATDVRDYIHKIWKLEDRF